MLNINYDALTPKQIKQVYDLEMEHEKKLREFRQKEIIREPNPITYCKICSRDVNIKKLSEYEVIETQHNIILVCKSCNIKLERYRANVRKMLKTLKNKKI